MMTLTLDLPQSGIDLHSDAVLNEPWPAYRTLRDMGSAVRLANVDAVFVGRFSDVKAALNDWQSFSSASGIGLNPIINAAWDEALICQDPPVHTERRKVMTDVLSPRALRPQAETIDARAAALADRLIGMGTFDGVTDFAHDLPIGVVMELVGWPHEVRPRLLEMADGSWNAAGPDNPRMREGLGQLEAMMVLIAEIYDSRSIMPGGLADQLIAVADAGQITRDTAIGMLAGYIVAAFETTISSMAFGLKLFAEHPAEWDKLRADPRLATAAANEIVRIESPIQNFSRLVVRDTEMSDGSVVPANSRAIVSYGSANRDERQFDQPDAFRIDRKEKLNLGFGYGPHGCAGQGLARMEMTAVFTALAGKVARFELAGDPQLSLNNVTRALRRLPVHAIPA
jgi:cytochrome P450